MRLRSSITLLAPALLTMSGIASMGMAPPPAPEQPEQRDRALDPAKLRERLISRLEETRRFEQRLQAAIARLEKGDNPDEVLKDQNGLRPDSHGKDRPDGKGERTDGGKPGPGQPLTQEDREKVLAFLKEHMPAAYERLMAAAKEEPANADRLMGRFFPRMHETMELRTSDPELFQLRLSEMRAGFDFIAAARGLSEAVKAGKPEPELLKFEAAIRKACEERFDAQIGGQRHELETLSRRIDRIKSEIDATLAGKEAKIAEDSSRAIQRARKGETGEFRSRRHGTETKPDAAPDSKPDHR